MNPMTLTEKQWINIRHVNWTVGVLMIFLGTLFSLDSILGIGVGFGILGFLVYIPEAWQLTKQSKESKLKELAREYDLPFGDESIFYQNHTISDLQRQITLDYRDYEDSVGECYCNGFDLECKRHEAEREAEREKKLQKTTPQPPERVCKEVYRDTEYNPAVGGVFVFRKWACGRVSFYPAWASHNGEVTTRCDCGGESPRKSVAHRVRTSPPLDFV